MNIDIIVPAYNESDRIEPTIVDFCTHFGGRANIIVVVNGSNDATADVVRRRMRDFANLTLVEIDAKIGKGGAVRVGFKAGNSPLAGFVDADGSMSAFEFDRLATTCAERNVDGVIGSRWLAGARVPVQQSLSRRVASRAFNALVRVLLRLRATDTQCGAKVFKRASLSRVLGQLTLSNFAFDIELLLVLDRSGAQVDEVPTTWRDSADGSKVALLPTAISMFRALLFLWLRDSLVSRVPYFESIAGDAMLKVQDSMRILVCSPQSPIANATIQAFLSAQIESWRANGHEVVWACERRSPDGLLLSRPLARMRLMFWYAFSDRHFDAIVEVAQARPYLFTALSRKLKFAIETAESRPVHVRYRAFHRLQLHGSQARVVTPEGNIVPIASHDGARLLRFIQSSASRRGIFTRNGKRWSVSFINDRSGQPVEKSLSI
jgi:hypothetical protein